APGPGPGRPGQPGGGGRSRGGAAGRVDPGEVPDYLGRGDLRPGGGRLQAVPDLGPPRPARPGRVLAQHVDGAVVAAAEPFQDLHRGGLARAVGPEQGEHLAAVDLEIDAADGRDVPVALAQVPDHDSGAVVHATSLVPPARRRISRAAVLAVIRSVDTGWRRPGPGPPSGVSSSAGRPAARRRNAGPPPAGGRGRRGVHPGSGPPAAWPAPPTRP